MGKVTVNDVAARAGLSRSTVSLVLNNSPLVATATRERVNAAISELGYVYDRTAASLRNARSGVIGLVVPALDNPYLTQFVVAAQDVLEAEGIIVLTGVTGDDPGRQVKLIAALAERRTDGLVVVPANGSTVADLGNQGAPMVQLVRRVPGSHTDSVCADNRASGRAVGEHLISHGARRFAFVGGRAHFPSYAPRADGLDEALNAAGIPPALRVESDPTGEAGRTAAARAVAAGVDALVCYSDEVALGVLADVGHQVPADLRVAAFDDMPAARYADLTSVASSGERAGREAARLLLRRLANPDAEPEHILVPTSLVARGSCCGAS